MPLCMEIGLDAVDIALDGDPAPPRKGHSSPNFRPMFIVVKRLDGSRCHLIGTEVGLSPGQIVLDGDPAPPKRGTASQFSAHACCGQTVAHLSYCSALVVE